MYFTNAKVVVASGVASLGLAMVLSPVILNRWVTGLYIIIRSGPIYYFTI